ncbi:MAG: adenosylmethionine decarboxylase [Thermoprotei archaeon]
MNFRHTTRGLHLLAELYGCSIPAISDVEKVRQTLVEAAKAAGSQPAYEHFMHLKPGVTGVVVVTDSHLSVHTWPETGYVSLDVYMCDPTCRPDVSLSIVCGVFKPAFKQVMLVERGVKGHLRLLKEPEVQV